MSTELRLVSVNSKNSWKLSEAQFTIKEACGRRVMSGRNHITWGIVEIMSSTDPGVHSEEGSMLETGWFSNLDGMLLRQAIDRADGATPEELWRDHEASLSQPSANRCRCYYFPW